MLKKLFNGVLDLVFPPTCRGCGIEGFWLCPRCIDRCGPPQFIDHPTRYVDRLICLGSYDSPALKKTIQDLKYSGGRIVSDTLGKALGALAVQQTHAEWIIPVPLHPTRERSRGFNQSKLLAHGVSTSLNIPIVCAAVRTRNTLPQVTLHERERAANVAGAFSVMKNIDFIPKSGIIVDDVFTTGATISEIARVLKNAGMVSITALTVAKG